MIYHEISILLVNLLINIERAEEEAVSQDALNRLDTARVHIKCASSVISDARDKDGLHARNEAILDRVMAGQGSGEDHKIIRDALWEHSNC